LFSAVSGAGQVSLSWAGVAGPVTGYHILRAATSGGTYIVIAATPGTTYTDTAVTNGTPYFYVVSAYNAVGDGPTSDEAMAEPFVSPAAPTVTPSYGYDSGGMRSWKQVGGVTTYFLYDGSQPVCELDGTGAVTATNTWGGSLLSRRAGAGLAAASTFYTFDPQGNLAQRLDASANVLGAYAFDAFGLRTGTDSTPDPYAGFEGGWGYYADAETGLSLLGHRYYDTGTGRFINRDPIGYAGGSNLYAYTANNPIMASDPSGFDPYAQGQKIVVHGQQGNYIIDVPVGQDINRNIQNARVYYNSEGGLGDGGDIDLENLYPLPGGRKYDYVKDHTATNTCGDYKDKPEYIDAKIDPELEHERRLAGNFNYGAMAHVFGFPLAGLLVAGHVDRMVNTRSLHGHPADEQQAIIDGYIWYSRHYEKK